jgi:hypothetical protein
MGSVYLVSIAGPRAGPLGERQEGENPGKMVSVTIMGEANARPSMGMARGMTIAGITRYAL